MSHEGISPEDAERLLIRPMEKELREIEGIKELRSQATQGHASVTLEFKAGFDSAKALLDVREKVDLAKPELPTDTDEPTVHEVNLSLFPVISVILTSSLPEREFLKIAKRLQDDLEAIPSVLEVDIAGEREETVDIIIDPIMLESYGLTSEIIANIATNNRLIAAGAMNSLRGSYQVKVPGLLEDLTDILNLPIKISGDATIKLSDIATVQKGFKDSTGFARVNGQPALVLEVSKRTGENIIETIEKVRAVVGYSQTQWPEGIQVTYSQDRSTSILDLINDLQNNIISAVFFVSLIIIAFIGVRSASLIAIAIPGSFLIGILVLGSLNLTMNMVVLFSLILSIGMLVDSAIITIEYANRRMLDGESYKSAYGTAAKRMAWPIIASTITTLLVFAPLLFWPGIIGQFMKYMPLTLIATLSGSLLMALIFLPSLGRFIGKPDTPDEKTLRTITITEGGNLDELTGFTASYLKWLKRVIHHPWKFIALILMVVVAIIMSFSMSGLGSEFFPEVEPENAQIQIKARGNLSVEEKDNITKEIEQLVLDMDKEIRVFYSRSGAIGGNGGGDVTEDVIGVIQLEFAHWSKRRTASLILNDVRERLNDIPGVIVEIRKQQEGPGAQRDINLEIASVYPEKIIPVAERLIDYMGTMEGLVDISDTRPVPGIEWEVTVNRDQAAKFGVSLGVIGNYIQLTTNGLKATDYRPDDNDEEVDIMIRFPTQYRDLGQLDDLRAITSSGAIPISNFVTRTAEQKVGRIDRVDGYRVVKIQADTVEGVLANQKLAEIHEWLKQQDFPEDVRINFKGDNEDQKETGDFLSKAFLFALVAMALILIIQFNSIYSTFIIMSAIFLSTGGVFLGLLVTLQPFGIVMCGVGIIALAGIVVNNNIIFIDTFMQLKKANSESLNDAILRTGAQRLRPILLTAGTTVLGLIPMVISMNIDFYSRTVTFGAPSTQWWNQLSTAIAGGLAFATILTLFFTPALLILGERFSQKKFFLPFRKKASLQQEALLDTK